MFVSHMAYRTVYCSSGRPPPRIPTLHVYVLSASFEPASFEPACLRLLGHDDGVDDVDDPVGAIDVGGHNLGVVDHNAILANLDGGLGAVDGGNLLAIPVSGETRKGVSAGLRTHLQQGVVHHARVRRHVGSRLEERVHGDDGLSHDLARHDVVREDASELLLVLGLEEVIDGALGKLCERLISRREDGERALALEGVHEAGSAERGSEGLERTSIDSCVDDVLHFHFDCMCAHH
jgi:hypothetical protein